MLNILSKLANAIRSTRFDAWLEIREQAVDRKEKSSRLAKALKQANSVLTEKRKAPIFK